MLLRTWALPFAFDVPEIEARNLWHGELVLSEQRATNIDYSWDNCKYFATPSTNSILDLSNLNLIAESRQNRVQTTSVYQWNPVNFESITERFIGIH
jgi:hypothetical protein